MEKTQSNCLEKGKYEKGLMGREKVVGGILSRILYSEMVEEAVK